MGRKTFLEIVQGALDLAEKNEKSENAGERAVAKKLNAVSRKMLNLFRMEKEISLLNNRSCDRSGLLATGQYLEAILDGMSNSWKRAGNGKKPAARQDLLRDLNALNRIAGSYVRNSNVRLRKEKSRLPAKGVLKKSRNLRK